MTRTPPLLAAVAAALALAACGSSGNPDNASQQDKAYEGAVKFSRCMRSHGIDLPDPKQDGHGGISLGVNRDKNGGKGPDPEDPRFQAAQKACGKYLREGAGKAPDAAQQAKARDAFVQYARCMRSKGIAMPDPKVGPGGGILVRIGGKGGSGPRPDSPAFKAADKICHVKLGDIEGPGGLST